MAFQDELLLYMTVTTLHMLSFITSVLRIFSCPLPKSGWNLLQPQVHQTYSLDQHLNNNWLPKENQLLGVTTRWIKIWWATDQLDDTAPLHPDPIFLLASEGSWLIPIDLASFSLVCWYWFYTPILPNSDQHRSWYLHLAPGPCTWSFSSSTSKINNHLK